MQVHDDGEGEVWKFWDQGGDPSSNEDEEAVENGILFAKQMQLLEPHQEAAMEGEDSEDAA